MKVKILNFDFGEADKISTDIEYYYAWNFIPSEHWLKAFHELGLRHEDFWNKNWNLQIDKEGNLKMHSINEKSLNFTCKVFIRDLGFSNLVLINAEEK